MAMIIFAALNGMAIVFLIYVLLQFWKDGHRKRTPAHVSFQSLHRRDEGPKINIVYSLHERPRGEQMVEQEPPSPIRRFSAR